MDSYKRTTSNYSAHFSLQHALSLLSLLCLHRSSFCNVSRCCTFLSFDFHVLTGYQLSHNSSWLQLLAFDSRPPLATTQLLQASTHFWLKTKNYLFQYLVYSLGMEPKESLPPTVPLLFMYSLLWKHVYRATDISSGVAFPAFSSLVTICSDIFGDGQSW
jgi:hypothetical protein